MPNNFSSKMKQQNSNALNFSDLIEDSDIRSMVNQAQSEGRYVSLPVDTFTPDPNQPRKTFESDKIDALKRSIEENGQLQPILVGKPLENGKYPIIAGERRWRAIQMSDQVTTIDAVVHAGEASELPLLIMQIDENNQREQIPAIENASAMKRVVDLCVANGKDQAYAARALSISKGVLSKNLSLLKAPTDIAELSISGETQDVDALYFLTKAAESDPKKTSQLIESWRKGELTTNLRGASRELASHLKKTKSEQKNANRDKTESSSSQKNTSVNVHRVSSISVDADDDDFLLTMVCDNVESVFKIDPDTIMALKEKL